MTTSGVLSVPEITKEYRISAAKIHAWIASGELPAINLATDGKKRPYYRIRKSDLDAFMNRRTITKTNPGDLLT